MNGKFFITQISNSVVTSSDEVMTKPIMKLEVTFLEHKSSLDKTIDQNLWYLPLHVGCRVVPAKVWEKGISMALPFANVDARAYVHAPFNKQSFWMVVAVLIWLSSEEAHMGTRWVVVIHYSLNPNLQLWLQGNDETYDEICKVIQFIAFMKHQHENLA